MKRPGGRRETGLQFAHNLEWGKTNSGPVTVQGTNSEIVGNRKTRFPIE